MLLKLSDSLISQFFFKQIQIQMSIHFCKALISKCTDKSKAPQQHSGFQRYLNFLKLEKEASEILSDYNLMRTACLQQYENSKKIVKLPDKGQFVIRNTTEWHAKLKAFTNLHAFNVAQHRCSASLIVWIHDYFAGTLKLPFDGSLEETKILFIKDLERRKTETDDKKTKQEEKSAKLWAEQAQIITNVMNEIKFLEMEQSEESSGSQIYVNARSKLKEWQNLLEALKRQTMKNEEELMEMYAQQVSDKVEFASLMTFILLKSSLTQLKQDEKFTEAEIVNFKRQLMEQYRKDSLLYFNSHKFIVKEQIFQQQDGTDIQKFLNQVKKMGKIMELLEKKMIQRITGKKKDNNSAAASAGQA